MNSKQKTFCDGAAFAYRDVADFLERMIDTAPPEIAATISALAPVAMTCRQKAHDVYTEAERFTGSRQ